jgi:hypothetical protein
MTNDLIAHCAALSLSEHRRAALSLSDDPLTILGHMEKGKTITPVEALIVYGIGRLSDCILKIRNAGMTVNMVMCKDERGRKYGKYSLASRLTIS